MVSLGLGVNGAEDHSFFESPPTRFWSALAQTNRPLRVLWLGDSVGADTALSIEEAINSLRPTAGGGPFRGFPHYYVEFSGSWQQNVSPLWYGRPFTLNSNTIGNWLSNSTSGLVLADTLSMAYLNDTNGGSFQVQYSTNGTNWTLLETINVSSAGSQGFAAKTYSLPLASYRGRTVGLGRGMSGKSDVLWLNLFETNHNVPQIILGNVGGIAVSSMTDLGSNSICAFLRFANPYLVFFEEKHGAGTYTDGQAALLRDWLASAATNADVWYVSSHITSDPTEPFLTMEENDWFRDFCATSGWSYVDGFSQFDSWSQIVAHHWNLDGVHLNTNGMRIIGDFAADKLLLRPKIDRISATTDATVTFAGRSMTGLTVILQKRANLNAGTPWENVATNRPATTNFGFVISHTGTAESFYRVLSRF